MARRGLSVPFPSTLAAELERRYGELNRRALELVRTVLVPAVESGDQARIGAALQEIENALGAEFTETELEKPSTGIGARINANHRRLFYPALGAAIGAKIVGSDAPGASAEAQGVTTGGRGLAAAVAGPQGSGAGVVPPLAPARVRGRGTLLVKLNAEPEILAENFAAENARMIKTLVPDIVPALRDEVVREVLLGQGDPERAAARLLAKWEKQGVPIIAPNRLATAKGKPGNISRINHRVRFIVHDQVSKLNAQIARARQQAAGVERFGWVSKRDSKVRPEHVTLDAQSRAGKSWRLDEGVPGVGFPGEPPNCRCHSVAVVDRDTVLKTGAFVTLGTGAVEFDV